MSPQNAMSLQSAAVGLALQAAVKQVEIAVERVGPRANVGSLGELTDDGLLAESLALLTVAEYNIALYQRFRLANIEATEPYQLPAAITSAHRLIAHHNKADQQLIDHLRSIVARLLKRNQLDLVSPFQTKKLEVERGEADELLSWFSDQRSLLYDPHVPADRRGMRDTLDGGAEKAKQAVEAATNRLPRRSGSPLELTEGPQASTDDK